MTRAERLKIIAALREEVDAKAPGGDAALAKIDAFMKKHVDTARPDGPARYQ